MAMRRVRRAAGVACALAALSGCEDFRLTEPPDGGLPMLEVLVVTTQRDSLRYQFTAKLYRPLYAEGFARPIPERRLEVNGVALAPHDSTRVWYAYGWTVVRPPNAPIARIEVRGPRVPGAAGVAVSVPLRARVGDARVTWPDAADLALRVAPAGPPAGLALAGAHWEARLAAEVAPWTSAPALHQTSGVGLLVAEVRWPAPLRGPARPLLASVQELADYRGAGQGYPVRALVGTLVEWRVAAP